MDNVRKETHVVSVTNKLRETVAEVGDEKDNRLPAPNSKAKTDGEGEKPSNESGNRDESSLDSRSKIPCRNRNCNNPSCAFWHPPVCETASLRLDAHLATNAISDLLRQMRRPARRQRKVVRKDQLQCWRRSLYNGLCVSRFLSEEIYCT